LNDPTKIFFLCEFKIEQRLFIFESFRNIDEMNADLSTKFSLFLNIKSLSKGNINRIPTTTET